MTAAQDRWDLIQGWLHKADTDLRAARLLLPHGPDLYDICGFHAQQAAEKFLKTFLVYHAVEPPTTHLILRLLTLVAAIDATVARTLRAADDLTPYAVDARYPGGSPEPDGIEVERLLNLAATVQAEILGDLSSYLAAGRP